MTCEHAGKSIAKRTGDGRLPMFVRLHIQRCPACLVEAKRMEDAIRTMRRDFLPRSPDFSAIVMSAIRLTPGLETTPVSFRNWLFVGIMLLAATGLSPLGAAFEWVKSTFGTGFLVPLNIVLGLMLAGYCALFIGTHLDEFSERLNLKHD
ncbi:MAG: hypothetical protein WCT14_01480 [Treponemataceae bacterium]